jgi:nucleoside 2-deoxyribosyltransferase
MKKLSVYLASRHEDRDDIIRVRKALVKNGINVTSRWLLEGGVLKTNVVENEREGSMHVLTNDLEDINIADAVVVFSPKKAFGNSTGGRHVEFGYSLAMGKKLILVGFRENVFHWHPDVTCVRTKKELFKLLYKLNTKKIRNFNYQSTHSYLD